MKSADDADTDVKVALDVMEGRLGAPDASEREAAFVVSVQTVRTIMGAFDSLGVAPPSVSIPPPFATWGPFVLREEIGRGASGIVCRAFDPAVEREVAVKLYKTAELPAEPRLMARVRHPNVVAVLGAAVHEGRPGIWMELVRGRTLADRLRIDGPVAQDVATRIGVTVCGALAAVHAAGLVHQDIKPHNVIEDENGRLVLMDFGAGVPRSDAPDGPPRLSGTPLYMAPEVVLGKTPTPQSDVYSLGVFLYHLLTGTYPVFASGFQELRNLHERQHHRTGTRRFVATLRELRPEVSAAFANCLARALAPAGQRYESAAAFQAALERTGAARPSTSPRRFVLGMMMASMALGAAVMYGVIPHRRPAREVVLQRLTWDRGIATDPTISPDGKRMAYASDRSGDGNLDIWLRPLAGGEPFRLTSDAADDYAPTFSPDGSRIAFRSERNGGGIYVVSALGGEAKLLAPQAHSPRFSPDGARIVCVLGAGRSGVTATGMVAVVPSGGGTPQPFPLLVDMSLPIWSSDGRHLLVLGPSPAAVLAAVSTDESEEDWWVAPSDPASTGLPIRTRARTAFLRAAFEMRNAESGVALFPRAFHWDGNRLLFSGALRGGNTSNLWEIGISPRTFQIIGTPRPLTTGTEIVSAPALAPDGTLVFAARDATTDLWEVALDANKGKVGSALRPLTHDPSDERLPTLADDGRTLAYSATRLGHPDLWVGDAVTGKHVALTSSADEEVNPVITRDGGAVVYSLFALPRRPVVYRVATRPGSVPEKICASHGVPTDVSRDGRFILLQHFPGWLPEHERYRRRATLGTHDRESGRSAQTVSHSYFNVYRGHLSPDERWIVFKGEHLSADTRVFIAPFRGTSPVKEEEWVQITDGSVFVDGPRWSPDGNLVYFVMDQDGFRCVWARALDPASKNPAGPLIPVLHVHGQRPSLHGVGSARFDIAIAEGRMVLNMIEPTATLWSATFD